MFGSSNTVHSIAFGPMFPGDKDVAHQPDEPMSIEKLMKCIELTAAAMAELAKK